MPRIVLASTSRYRAALLERMGLTFDVAAPHCDEAPFHDRIRDPRELASTLAEAKAQSVRGRCENGTILIGSDQVAALEEGPILTKPGNHERAFAQLQSLRGRTHHLYTALSVVQDERTVIHVDDTRLTMRSLDDDALERYLRADEPYDCVGCYKLECRGITLFESIESRDHTAITGLPLLELTRTLAALGVSVP